MKNFYYNFFQRKYLFKENSLFQVFNLDISRQLHAYEVEYHVLLEEMIHSPSQSNPELENLQIANKNLKAQNMELMDQLQVFSFFFALFYFIFFYFLTF